MASTNGIEQDLLRLVRTQGSDQRIASLPFAALPGSVQTPPAAPSGEATAGAGDAVGELSRELASLRRQLSVAEETARKQSDIFERNTRAILDSSTRSTAGTVAREAVSTVRNAGGLGVLGSPIIGLLSGLLGRRNETAASPLTPFSLPSSVSEDLGVPSTSQSGLAPVSYNAEGVPRAPQPSAAAAPGANVIIQVQTMDSRSFLDNSDQIARAVREAMLHSHALNDVIGEM